MSVRTWYRFQNAAEDSSVVDIYINDFIGDWIDDYWGFGVTARQFLEQLSGLDARVSTIRVHLNSPGGDVFAAHQIANALRDQRVTKNRTVETIVDGLAASAATIIMMAGSPVRVSDTAVVMVHNPWSVGVGNSEQMRKLADDLDVVRDTIVAAYQWHSALSSDELIALMDAETWMDADEAIAHGLADEKVEGLRAAASLDPRALAKLTIPDRLRDRVAACLRAPEAAPTPTPPPAAMAALDVLQACRAAECLDLAEGLLADGATAQTVQARISARQAQRAADTERRATIEALCATARQPELSAIFVAGGISPDAVRQALTVITAKQDQVEIDANLPPDQARSTAARAIDRKAIYARFNQPGA